jgi:hypothetical protein
MEAFIPCETRVAQFCCAAQEAIATLLRLVPQGVALKQRCSSLIAGHAKDCSLIPTGL